jgi:hypothetical protein
VYALPFASPDYEAATAKSFPSENREVHGCTCMVRLAFPATFD